MFHGYGIAICHPDFREPFQEVACEAPERLKLRTEARNFFYQGRNGESFSGSTLDKPPLRQLLEVTAGGFDRQ
ncbi:hypothetical protein [Phenylobacterium ferrooxidans]|uniref:Uncharacterized protein n=1 Tax=Phenylobacterium ferrooxidans TaxID=2982689 RepID=A0ABW6CIW9_9CAUL